MTTVERIWGRRALKELSEMPLSPLEKQINDLLFETYQEALTSRPVQYDLLPACYRKVKIT
jgi:hypothetical protein